MYCEEYGTGHEKIIVMLHGANFVHSFGRQYVLSEKYHIIVPHLMGYGNETDKTFDADKQVQELAAFIQTLGRKVVLVGFSLGAQIAVRLVAEYEYLFSAAVIVSPWLDKNTEMMAFVLGQNEKQYKSLKNEFTCNLIGLMNGLPKAQRKEFVDQMQRVTLETVKASVYNGITIDSVPGFKDVTIPVYALAGAKEQDGVKNSVKALAGMNPHCKYEIWDKAAHNIPPLFYKRFNALIEKIASNENEGI
jgi:pimeloyl-ACP methyl ester carboxylesterase